MVKVGVTVGTWETLPSPNFVKKIALGDIPLLGKYILKITNFCDFGGSKPTFLKPQRKNLAWECKPGRPSPCQIWWKSVKGIYHFGANYYQKIPIFTILMTSLTAQRLHRRMIPIFPCDSRRSKGVPSGTGVFLRLLVGELGPPNLPKFSPMGNGYTHTECY